MAFFPPLVLLSPFCPSLSFCCIHVHSFVITLLPLFCPFPLYHVVSLSRPSIALFFIFLSSPYFPCVIAFPFVLISYLWSFCLPFSLPFLCICHFTPKDLTLLLCLSLNPSFPFLSSLYPPAVIHSSICHRLVFLGCTLLIFFLFFFLPCLLLFPSVSFHLFKEKKNSERNQNCFFP